MKLARQKAALLSVDAESPSGPRGFRARPAHPLGCIPAWPEMRGRRTTTLSHGNTGSMTGRWKVVHNIRGPIRTNGLPITAMKRGISAPNWMSLDFAFLALTAKHAGQERKISSAHCPIKALGRAIHIYVVAFMGGQLHQVRMKGHPIHQVRRCFECHRFSMPATQQGPDLASVRPGN